MHRLTPRHALSVLVLVFAVDCAGRTAEGPCPDERVRCGGTCVNLRIDDEHCGTCGAACVAADACAGGRCVPRDCPGADCAPVQVCLDDACRERACVGVICPPRMTCVQGVCSSIDCDGVTCPLGSVCNGGRCTDAWCLGVLCPPSTICSAGRCIPTSCDSTPCPQGFGCLDRQCVDVACLGVTCPASRVCVHGVCVSTGACADGALGGSESDVDCGGACPKCVDGKRCNLPGDCASGTCLGGLCGARACTAPSECPPVANALSTCDAGRCGRGPCRPGFFDFDREVTPGCEVSCSGTRCTLPDGGAVVATQPPLSEVGLTFHALASGGSHGGLVQTSATHTLQGVLGEPTPGGAGGVAELSNARHRLVGGFSSILSKR